MSWKKRYRPPPDGFRSTFESQLSKRLKGLAYEKMKIDYVIPHKYTADFHYDTPTYRYLIEAKGWFRDKADSAKYTWINKAVEELHATTKHGYLPCKYVFIFDEPGKKCYSGLKRRVDGTYYSMAEWADRNDILWYAAKDVEKILELP